MTSQPTVSIIVPNYNHAAYLPERIESILKQHYQNFELIILDDVSSDSSVEVINKYLPNPKITHVLCNNANSGSTFAQWQKGINLAKGKYIWLAESDDVATADFLSSMVPVLEQQPNIGVAFCASQWIDSESNRVHEPGHEANYLMALAPNCIVHFFAKGPLIYNASAAVFRKSLLNQVDFDTIKKFKYTGDWLFWVQILANNGFVRLAKRNNFFRRHTQNISGGAEASGLVFAEGLQVLQYIFAKYRFGFWAKQKITAYWALRLAQSKARLANQHLALLPKTAVLYYNFFKIFARWFSLVSV
jgi:glycosyltransferase involved in cell wall biosynthesis